jgi:hypothetical protein
MLKIKVAERRFWGKEWRGVVGEWLFLMRVVTMDIKLMNYT